MTSPIISTLEARLAELTAALDATNHELALLQRPPLVWTLAIDGEAVNLNPPLVFEEAKTWAGLLAAQFPENKFQVVTA